MANTKKLGKDERKKAKRVARKKVKAEKPKKGRDYARGSKKRKVKKMVRGAALIARHWSSVVGIPGRGRCSFNSCEGDAVSWHNRNEWLTTQATKASLCKSMTS
jgi:hypothetical protein